MTEQNEKIFNWDNYVDRLRKANAPAHGGGSGGFGKTPGQLLKDEVLRTCIYTCATLQWLHETLEDAEWEKAATLKRAAIIYKLPNFTYMLDSCRAKKRATAAQKRYLERIIFPLHDDQIDAAVELKQALKDPLGKLHYYKLFYKHNNMPFPTDNDKA